VVLGLVAKTQQESLRRSEPLAGALSPRWQSVLSIFFVVHFFFVFTALSSSWTRSPLQSRILSKFACYAQLLNLDSDFAPLANTVPVAGPFTRADALDVDHRIEILPRDGDPEVQEDWLVMPDRGLVGGERYKRFQRLARVFDQLAERDEDAARVARAVAVHAWKRQGIEPAQVRCRRHLLQSWEQAGSDFAPESGPDSEAFFTTPYAADILIRGESVSVKRNLETGQLALPGEPLSDDGVP
jgi:hypothetical protein